MERSSSGIRSTTLLDFQLRVEVCNLPRAVGKTGLPVRELEG